MSAPVPAGGPGVAHLPSALPPSRVGGLRPQPSTAGPVDAVSLGALLARAGAAVRAGLPEPVWVAAAVVAVQTAKGGWSLELADAEAASTAQLRAYLPEGVVAALRHASGQAADPALLAGLTVVLRLGLELHPRWGASGRVAALAPGVETSLAARAVEAARARLAAEGLLERQRRRPAPADVTRLAVVHPPEAAGWGDVSAELRRWAAAGALALRSVPTPFEGEGAAAGLAAALARAAAPIDGGPPDLVLLLRGGGARGALAPLDDERLARAIARAAVPVVTGLGHARDRTLADEAVWRAADTPSKALALVRDLVARPARRARADHAAALAAVRSGFERAGGTLEAEGRRAAAEARARVAEASARLEAVRAASLGGGRAARERLERRGDGLDVLMAGVATAIVARCDGADGALAARLAARAETGPGRPGGGAGRGTPARGRHQPGGRAARGGERRGGGAAPRELARGPEPARPRRCRPVRRR